MRGKKENKEEKGEKGGKREVKKEMVVKKEGKCRSSRFQTPWRFDSSTPSRITPAIVYIVVILLTYMYCTLYSK